MVEWTRGKESKWGRKISDKWIKVSIEIRDAENLLTIILSSIVCRRTRSNLFRHNYELW